jgi:hypothetical protein
MPFEGFIPRHLRIKSLKTVWVATSTDLNGNECRNDDLESSAGVRNICANDITFRELKNDDTAFASITVRMRWKCFHY